jgi:hypothetical protein
MIGVSLDVHRPVYDLTILTHETGVGRTGFKTAFHSILMGGSPSLKQVFPYFTAGLNQITRLVGHHSRAWIGPQPLIASGGASMIPRQSLAKLRRAYQLIETCIVPDATPYLPSSYTMIQVAVEPQSFIIHPRLLNCHTTPSFPTCHILYWPLLLILISHRRHVGNQSAPQHESLVVLVEAVGTNFDAPRHPRRPSRHRPRACWPAARSRGRTRAQRR